MVNLEPLAEAAATRLASLGYSNIEVVCGDGYGGLPEQAPFDAIMVTAAPPEVPAQLAAQLKEGGRMIVPVGSFFQELYLITKTAADVETKPLLSVRFVPMVRPEKR